MAGDPGWRWRALAWFLVTTLGCASRTVHYQRLHYAAAKETPGHPQLFSLQGRATARYSGWWMPVVMPCGDRSPRDRALIILQVVAQQGRVTSAARRAKLAVRS